MIAGRMIIFLMAPVDAAAMMPSHAGPPVYRGRRLGTAASITRHASFYADSRAYAISLGWR